MLHTKFHGNRDNDSGEEGFQKGLTKFGFGGQLGHVVHIICIHFHFLVPIIKFANDPLV